MRFLLHPTDQKRIVYSFAAQSPLASAENELEQSILKSAAKQPKGFVELLRTTGIAIDGTFGTTKELTIYKLRSIVGCYADFHVDANHSWWLLAVVDTQNRQRFMVEQFFVDTFLWMMEIDLKIEKLHLTSRCVRWADVSKRFSQKRGNATPFPFGLPKAYSG